MRNVHKPHKESRPSFDKKQERQIFKVAIVLILWGGISKWIRLRTVPGIQWITSTASIINGAEKHIIIYIICKKAMKTSHKETRLKPNVQTWDEDCKDLEIRPSRWTIRRCVRVHVYILTKCDVEIPRKKKNRTDEVRRQEWSESVTISYDVRKLTNNMKVKRICLRTKNTERSDWL